MGYETSISLVLVSIVFTFLFIAFLVRQKEDHIIKTVFKYFFIVMALVFIISTLGISMRITDLQYNDTTLNATLDSVNNIISSDYSMILWIFRFIVAMTLVWVTYTIIASLFKKKEREKLEKQKQDEEEYG